MYKITIEKSMEEVKTLVDVDTAASEDIFISYEKIQTDDEFNNALKIRTLRYTLSSAMEVSLNEHSFSLLFYFN